GVRHMTQREMVQFALSILASLVCRAGRRAGERGTSESTAEPPSPVARRYSGVRRLEGTRSREIVAANRHAGEFQAKQTITSGQRRTTMHVHFSELTLTDLL